MRLTADRAGVDYSSPRKIKKVLVIALVVVTAVFMVSSFLLWAAAARRIAAGAPVIARESAPRSQPHVVAFIIALLLVVAMAVVLFLFETPELTAENLSAAALGEAIFLALFLWGVVAGTTPTLDGWGIRFEQPGKQIGLGIATGVAALLPTTLLGMLLQGIGEEQQTIRILRESGSPQVWAFFTVSAVVLAPLWEEMAFRVAIQGWLAPRAPTAVAIGVAAGLFVVVHGWPAMLGLIPFALMIGYLYRQTGSLLGVVVMHMTFNASMLLMLAAQLAAE